MSHSARQLASVSAGSAVKEGDVLLTVSAMKMEVKVSRGQQI